MESVSVLGAGIMGHSIALNVAWSGQEVTLLGTDGSDLKRAEEGINQKLEVLEANGLIGSLLSSEILGRFRFETSLEDALRGASFIIEAIPEDLELKKAFCARLDQLCDASVVVASNTSGLSPTAIAEEMKIPERMVVTHFWNPAHLVPLVEVVRGMQTSSQTVDRAFKLLYKLEKKPIEVKKIVPGFVANRLQYALFREAQHLLEEGVASMEDIDTAVMYSIGRRLSMTGPFMTADMGGLDVFHAISEYLFHDLSKKEGSFLTLKGLVSEGYFGIKNGKGFYDWSPELKEEMNRKREEVLIRFLVEDKRAT